MADDKTYIIRAHGLGRAHIEALHAAGATVIDATCPYVSKIHNIAEQCERDGVRLYILGDKSHPEVIGVAGWCNGSVVVEDAAELEHYFASNTIEDKAKNNAALVVQTTMTQEKWEETVKVFKKYLTAGVIHDTICSATRVRQEEVVRLASECDAMVVVGDKASANTEKLASLCKQHCETVIRVENADQWKKRQCAECMATDNACDCFTRYSALTAGTRCGLTAGASTPDWSIEEVVIAMTQENNITETIETPINEAEMGFEELLEQSIKEVRTGYRVKAYVVGVTPAEVQLDLGIKYAGFIPIDEVSADPDVKIEECVKVGEEIDVFVVHVSDRDGMVKCSKKKVDAMKYIEVVAQAYLDKTIVEGVVTGHNKGGVEVTVNGVRVFIPASQTGVPRDGDMSALLKKRVKLYVTECELGGRRDRIIGSIRAAEWEERQAEREERKAKAAALRETLEVGQEFDGVVKTLTKYGAFIDIGGVDGLLHISEMGWGRVHRPEQYCKVGDKLKVRVVNLGEEDGKISLSTKDPDSNPWTSFIGMYRVDDVAPVKIVRLETFGAFANIMEGVDGLIHISAISHERTTNIRDVLEVGQSVDAKIMGIDYENEKISLSLKALQPEPVAAIAEPVEGDAPVAAEDEVDEAAAAYIAGAE